MKESTNNSEQLPSSPVFEYERQPFVIPPDVVGAKRTRIAGWTIFVAWIAMLVQVVLSPAYPFRAISWVAVLVLPSIATVLLIGALVNPPNSRYTRFVGGVIAIYWSTLLCFVFVAAVRYALSLDWLILPI